MASRFLAPVGEGHPKHCLQMTKSKTITIFFIALCLAFCAGTLHALAEDDRQPIAESQQRVSERYDRLELLAGRLAELSTSTQPRRARLLREFVSQSRERDLTGRFEQIVLALQQEKLASAVKDQDSLQSELEQLLELLLQEDRDTQIEAERKRIARYLAELKKLIRKQSGIKARTEGRDDQQELSDDQREAAADAGSLSEDIKQTEGSKEDSKNSSGEAQSSKNGENKPTKDESGEKQSSENQSEAQDSSSKESQQGKPSEGKQGQPSESPSEGQNSQSRPSEEGSPSQSGQPQSGQPQQSQPGSGENSQQDTPQKPADRAAERLKKAQQRMQQALDKLKDAQHSDAMQAQEDALRELEQAKAELEKILRQLREEEKERMLMLLEARFRKMLDAQIAVYEQTQQLDLERSQVEAHELAIASARLSRKEKQIVREAERALVLLREDGTSVAFPVALEQAKEDMESVAERLSDGKIAAITQALEEDIIAALEETLAALQQALQEMRDKKSQPQQGGGQPEEQPLVDKLAELRMIRALQNRINRRTVLYGNMIEGEQAIEAELLEALDELAQREECVYRATLDLHQGANQ